MTAQQVDGELLAALAELDAAADARSMLAEPSESVVARPGQPAAPAGQIAEGDLALAITFAPMVGNALSVTIRAPYNDRTAEFVRALAKRVLVARTWDPIGWARQAVEDVLGTRDAPAEEVALTAELPPADA